jgi:hypothetical protein
VNGRTLAVWSAGAFLLSVAALAAHDQVVTQRRIAELREMIAAREAEVGRMAQMVTEVSHYQSLKESLQQRLDAIGALGKQSPSNAGLLFMILASHQQDLRIESAVIGKEIALQLAAPPPAGAAATLADTEVHVTARGQTVHVFRPRLQSEVGKQLVYSLEQVGE